MKKPPRPPAPQITPEEMALWRTVTEDVTPIKQKPISAADTHAVQAQRKNQTILSSPSFVSSPISPPARSPARAKDLDRRTKDKLVKGKMEIEGKLDLHGMTQARAYEALLRFILTSHQAGKRCVLVITGKGNKNTHSEEQSDQARGILRRRLPEWISHPALHDLVLSVETAQPKHGGSGAVYLYLRRTRSD
ncbi:MAG: Smr/MutS family protein [Alphaproteobacteria bacterium]|nr:Smr/MutS family protein [Alphaproteobacteria bacterium]